jgi:hypothetical protein
MKMLKSTLPLEKYMTVPAHILSERSLAIGNYSPTFKGAWTADLDFLHYRNVEGEKIAPEIILKNYNNHQTTYHSQNIDALARDALDTKVTCCLFTR